MEGLHGVIVFVPRDCAKVVGNHRQSSHTCTCTYPLLNHQCVEATKIKCMKMKYTYMHYMVELVSNEIFVIRKFKTLIILISRPTV